MFTEQVIASGFSDRKNSFNLTDSQKSNLMTVDEYRKFAIVTLGKLKKKYGSIVYKILKSEELLSEIMHAVMYADSTFNADKSSLTTYRTNHIIWTIGDLITRINTKTNMNKKITNGYSYTTKTNPISEYDNLEENEFRLNKIKKCLLLLEENERVLIQDYFFKEKSIKQISKENNVLPQTIYRKINETKRKIKEMVGA